MWVEKKMSPNQSWEKSSRSSHCAAWYGDSVSIIIIFVIVITIIIIIISIIIVIIVIEIIINAIIVIIIIIITRPWPAFGRLGLGGSSEGTTSHG